MGKREKKYLKDMALYNEVDHEASAEKFPDTYAKLESLTHGSGKKLVWECSEGHSWVSTISNRAWGKGCPLCSGRDATLEVNLQVVSPLLASEWAFDLNGDLTPEDVRPQSNKKVFWVCLEGHNPWKARIASRYFQGSGCPLCKGHKISQAKRVPPPGKSLAEEFPEITKEWDYYKNNIYTPETINSGATISFYWVCKANHSWFASAKNRTRHGSGCPECSKKYGKIENRFIDKFINLTPFKISARGLRLNQMKHKSGRSGVEVDMIFYYDHHYLLVEYDGSYWHREKIEKDIEKSQLLLSLGDNILHARIRENDLPDLDLAHDRFAQFRHDYHATESASIEDTVREIEKWFLEKIGDE